MALNLFLPIAGVGLVALLAYSSSSSSTEEGGGSGGGGRPPPGGGGGGGSDHDYVATAAEIKNAQQCLIIVGLLPAGSADGKMGPQTSAALKAFQVKYGLKDQSGKLTKETVDLVCEADSPVADLIKGGMTKEDANRYFAAGRSAGQNAATSKQPKDPAPYYYAASADTSARQNAFDKGFSIGYDEAKLAGAGSSEDTTGGGGGGSYADADAAAYAAGKKAGITDATSGVPRRGDPANEIGGGYVVSDSTRGQFNAGYNEGYGSSSAVMGAAAAAAMVFPRSRVQMGAPPVARPRGVRYHEDGTPYLA